MSGTRTRPHKRRILPPFREDWQERFLPTAENGLRARPKDEEALPEELQAAPAHELGHVQLGHFTARRERRTAERKTRDEINAKGSAGGAPTG